jgi:hypothetical protein
MSFLKEYNKYGFIIIKNFFNLKNNNILFNINEIFKTKLLIHNKKYKNYIDYNDLFYNMNNLFDINQLEYLSSARLASNLIDIKRLCLSIELENQIRSLGLKGVTVPTDPVLHIMSRELQVEGGYLGFEPHQDWVSMQGSLNSVVAWIPLCDVDEDSFPIQVVPESHRYGMIDNKCIHNDGSRITQGSETSINIKILDSDFLDVLVSKGDLVIFSSWLIHRTKIDPGLKPRIAISTRFEDFSDATWAARNYPSAYKRVVQREIITPNFPSKQQVLKNFE